jgi:hypothetical protein
VVIGLLALGTYWSVKAYNDWQSNLVLTTVNTTAFPVTGVEFPAFTICAPGQVLDVSSERFCSSRGRCYDHNFLQFPTIFDKKLALFSKTTVMVKILHDLALF